MSDEREQTRELLARLRSNEDAEVSRFVTRYASRLKGLAYRRLRDMSQAREEASDVVNSALKSFLLRHRDGSLGDQLTDESGIWSLLAAITICKCINRRKYANALCRRGSVPLAEGDDLAEPSHEDAVMLGELIEKMLAQFDEADREIVVGRMQGAEVQEIAREHKTSARTVARVIARAKEVLGGMLD